MRLFLRAHRAPTAVAISSMLMIAAWWLSGTSIPVPQLLQGRAAPVAIEMMFSALYAPLVAYTFGGVPLRVEHGAQRRLLCPDLVLVAVFCAPVAVIALIAAVTGAGGFAADITRDAMAFLGMALLILSVAGEQAATTVPMGYFLISCLLGAGPGGSAQWWAPLRVPATPATVVGALMMVAMGVVVFRWSARSAAVRRVAQV